MMYLFESFKVKVILLFMVLTASIFLCCGCMQEQSPDTTDNDHNELENSEDAVKEQVDIILSDYFKYRESSVFKAHEAKNSTDPVPLEKSFDYNFMSEDIIELAQTRADGIRDYLNNCELVLIDSETFFGVKDYRVESDVIHVTVYEAIAMEWMFESVKEPFESSWGIYHDIYIDPISMAIKAVSYDEEFFSEVSVYTEHRCEGRNFDEVAEFVETAMLNGDWDTLAQMGGGFIESSNEDGTVTLVPQFKLEKEIFSIDYRYTHDTGYHYYVEYKDGTRENFPVGIYEEQGQTKIIILY